MGTRLAYHAENRLWLRWAGRGFALFPASNLKLNPVSVGLGGGGLSLFYPAPLLKLKNAGAC